MQDGKILFAEKEGIYVIQLCGRVLYTISQGMDKLISQIEEDPTTKEIIIDLTETDYLDSTNLGLLAKVANFSISRLNKQPILISNNNEVNTILSSMGFEQVFQITSSWSSEKITTHDIPETSAITSAKLILEAHRSLCNMNEQNAEAFRDVVELLKTEASREGA